MNYKSILDSSDLATEDRRLTHCFCSFQHEDSEHLGAENIRLHHAGGEVLVPTVPCPCLGGIIIYEITIVVIAAPNVGTALEVSEVVAAD